MSSPPLADGCRNPPLLISGIKVRPFSRPKVEPWEIKSGGCHIKVVVALFVRRQLFKRGKELHESALQLIRPLSTSKQGFYLNLKHTN